MRKTTEAKKLKKYCSAKFTHLYPDLSDATSALCGVIGSSTANNLFKENPPRKGGENKFRLGVMCHSLINPSQNNDPLMVVVFPRTATL